MIDHGRAVVIGTQGDIGLCEHYSENHFWGHIDKPEMKDMEEIKKFQTYEEDLPICQSCQILPSCIRAKMCVDLSKCNIYIKEHNIKKAHASVKDMYATWFNNIQQEIKQQEENNKQENIVNEINETKGIRKYISNIIELFK